MAKKNLKKKKTNVSLLNKSAAESLAFQTHWGLKQLGIKENDGLYAIANTEIEIVSELEMIHDMLSIKKLIDGTKQNLQVSPEIGLGDFLNSALSIGLGIASIQDMTSISNPISWYDMKRKKLMKIYYHEGIRNEVVSWAKDNGFNTSTYLGRPIVKFTNIYLIIERTRS